MIRTAKRELWTYFFIRLLCKSISVNASTSILFVESTAFVLKVFYGSIVVENEDFIPPDGSPLVICANHTNGLTDAMLLIAAVPSKLRSLLRMTADDIHFGQKTFISWLIESVGTVAMQRREAIGDTVVSKDLVKSLGNGDCVCLFPQGMSRYHPGMAPLNSAVAKIVANTITAQKANPDFELTLLTCSITYMHRERFRSDVLVSFNRPLKLRPKDFPQLIHPVDLATIRSLTAFMASQISSQSIFAPNQEILRVAKLAARMYTPSGTQMTLGDHVRVTRLFADGFSGVVPVRNWEEENKSKEDRESDDSRSTDEESSVPDDNYHPEIQQRREKLGKDLGEYQDFLNHLGIKDERMRRALPRAFLFYLIVLQLAWMFFLLFVSIPGLILWSPIYATTSYAVWKFKMSGPIWGTFDGIAQYKMVYGMASAVAVYAISIMVTWPIIFVTLWAVPLLMWLTLQWWEDALSAARALNALFRLFLLGRHELRRTKVWRDKLYIRVMEFAEEIGLPKDPEVYFVRREGKEKDRAKGSWESGSRYFSLKKRRRDWNDALQWYDVTDIPAIDT